MANTQDILLTYRTDTGEVTRSLDDIVKGLDGVDKKLDDTGKKTGGLGKSLTKSSSEGVKGFKVLDTALKASGIVWIASKFIEFAGVLMENKKVAETLEVVMAAIGAVMNQLFQAAAPLGDAIMNAFKNPMETIKNIGKAIKDNLITRFEGLLEFLPAIGNAISLVFEGKWKEAGKVAADAAGKMVLGVENITDKVSDTIDAVGEFANEFIESSKKAINASNNLVKQQQRLRDQQRDLNVEYAQARAEIEQLKQQRDDERLSIEERIEAAQLASEKDAEFAKKRMDIANAEVALIQREITLQGDSIERQDRLAEAKIAAAEAAESSAAVQTELMTSIAGLQNEELARQQELIDKERERIDAQIALQDELYNATLSGYDAEEQALLAAYDKRIAIAGDDEGLIKAATEQLNNDLTALNKKYADEERKQKQENVKANLQMASNAMGALMALNEAFAGDTEAEQKRAFERNKRFQIGQAIIQTAQAVTGALTAGGNPLKLATGAQFVEAAVALATGVAQVATIKKTRFGGGDTGSDSISRPTTPTGTTPQLDLGFLGAGAGQTGFRTYVVSSEVSNAQQANQRINDQASLVG